MNMNGLEACMNEADMPGETCQFLTTSIDGTLVSTTLLGWYWFSIWGGCIWGGCICGIWYPITGCC